MPRPVDGGFADQGTVVRTQARRAIDSKLTGQGDQPPARAVGWNWT